MYKKTRKFRSYAKINFALEVCKKRADTYHELKMINFMINLFDEITITIFNEEIDNNQNITYIIDNYRALICNDIIYKTICVLKNEGYINESMFFKIRVNKRIPMGGGLGGGSSDAATVLIGLNQIYKLKISHQEMLRLSMLIGADVPYFLVGGLCRVGGLGEIVESISDVLIERRLLLIIPNTEISTEDIFANHIIDRDGSQIDLIIKYLSENNFNNAYEVASNDLLTTALKVDATFKKIHNKIKRALIKNNPENKNILKMSGSGSGLFIMDAQSKLSEYKKIIDNLNLDIVTSIHETII